MPRKQSTFVKYRCREPFCAKLIRQDKWPAHCKKEHSFKFRRWVYYFDNISALINCGLGPTDAALLLSHGRRKYWFVLHTAQQCQLCYYKV